MHKSENKTRMAIAELAARLIAENGLITYHSAKHKAAERLGNTKKKNLPTNIEIEQSIKSYQSLFQKQTQTTLLAERRHLTLEIMQLLEEFRPRLVGSVLNGTSGNHSEITIHVFSDNLEMINFCLEEYDIPYLLTDKKIRTTEHESNSYPACCFVAGDIPITLIVFPERSIRHAPLCPIDGKPMQRADVKKLRSLM